MLRLNILGSGDAFNSAGALHSCYLLDDGKSKLLLECGPSVLAGLKRDGIDTSAPDAVLVSHLHGDHFGGIPFLFLEYKFKNPRTRPLTIAGPPTTEKRVSDLYAALYKDIRREEMSFDLEYVVVEPGKRFRLNTFELEAFEVPHSAEPFCLGYRISAGGTNMMFSGDSAWTHEFVDRSKGVDVFLCECCTMEPVTPVHTCYRDILAHRDMLQCKRLILTHLGEDVRASSGIEVERARDGQTMELGK